MCCRSMRIFMLVFLTFISFLLNRAYPELPVIGWYFINVNVFAFLLFSIDKYHAIKGKKRVPEMGLYYFSFIGGIVGALLSMLLFNHKLSKSLFLWLQLGILCLWACAITFVLLYFESIMTTIKGLFS